MVRGLVASGAGVEIEMAALSRHETELIVAAVAGRPVSEGEADAAWELSVGNPFFAVEVAASLAGDAGASGGAAGVLTARLACIGPEARRALRATALVTDEFDADVLAAVSGLAPHDALDIVRDATAAGIVATGEAGYRFRHDLVRTTLTADATDAERRDAHGAFAEWLAATGAAAGRVAHHLLAAGRPEDALPHQRAAAGHALAVGAHGDALALADAGLRVAPGDAALLAVRADALFGAGNPEAAGAYAVAIAAARGAPRSALAVRRARALVLAGDIPAALAELDAVEATDPADRVQELVTRGIALWCAGAVDEAASLGDEARHLAEAAGDLRDFVDATMLQAMVAHERGAWPQRAALDLLDEHIRPDLAVLVVDALLCVAESYLYGGVAHGEVIAFAADLRARAARAGIGHAEAFATTLLGEVHLLGGEVGLATDLLATATALYRRVGVLCGEALSLQRLAEAHLAVGDAERAQGVLGEALVAARGSPVATRHLLDRIHGTAIRAALEPAAAVAAVDEAARAVQGPLESCPPCSVNRTIPASIACADAGDVARAREFLAGAEQVVAAFYQRGGWHAALDEARAHLAAAEGDLDGADRHLRRAVGGFEREGQALDAQRCRALLVAGKV
jgi:tetratricopeptide (TPR) repeat protein